MRVQATVRSSAAAVGIVAAFAFAAFVLAWWFFFPVVGLLWFIGWLH